MQFSILVNLNNVTFGTPFLYLDLYPGTQHQYAIVIEYRYLLSNIISYNKLYIRNK